MLTENFRYLKEPKRSPPKWVAWKNKPKEAEIACMQGQAAVGRKPGFTLWSPFSGWDRKAARRSQRRRAHQLSAGKAGLRLAVCSAARAPQPRRASSDASRAWALRLWRTDPGRGRGGAGCRRPEAWKGWYRDTGTCIWKKPGPP